MRYDSAKSNELYETWVMQFSSVLPDLLIDELARILRSKLTSLLGTAQILADDLEQLEPATDDIHHMIETIIQSGRHISIMLDAAIDIRQVMDERQTSPGGTVG